MNKTVFVSGATGFIALHIIKQLIEREYDVVGSVRTDEKGQDLSRRFGPKFEYEIVEDIAAEGAFDEAIKKHPEVTTFLHTASPFTFDIKDENDLLVPAINGTKNALDSIIKFGPQINRVVITSSYVAIFDGRREFKPDAVFTEESWNPITYEDAKKHPQLAYWASKKFAELSAWDIIKEKKPNFSLTTINPPFVFGPQAFDSEIRDTLNTSSEIINQILGLQPESKIPKIFSSWIDVRDVAKAHILAFEKDSAKGKRLLVRSGQFSSFKIVEYLKEIPQIKDALPEPGIGDHEKAIRSLATVDNSKTNSILKLDYINLHDSIIDSAQQILSVRSKL
ncbi:uncharacterized protein KQ657_000213 [Scheffersomyces spartinae]|uniref:3-beta hydroxysteroid dehydrogenase/isomerase domain-containing protein n=1 Tax=Scheffersomyces spartinae TaxID=45513 RepID=A0A9P8AKR3_9ASCO|nr:uncharacterized protein KQ657_000213 [Scheffersomyces spartinae]KAG7196201.1 hypothetical protein KQ657_000213 [Scheffersomyces spartinae]